MLFAVIILWIIRRHDSSQRREVVVEGILFAFSCIRLLPGGAIEPFPENDLDRSRIRLIGDCRCHRTILPESNTLGDH